MSSIQEGRARLRVETEIGTENDSRSIDFPGGASGPAPRRRINGVDATTEEQEQVPCPLCGSESERLMLQVQDTMFAQPGRYRLVECQDCAMRYLNPRPTPSALARHYPNDYLCFTNFDGEHWLLNWAFRQMQRGQARRRLQHIEAVAGKLAKGTRVLDVGCGRGELLARLQSERGCVCVGTDVNPDVLALVREAHGIPTLQGYLPDLDLAPESFDLITMTEYLEHESNPVPVIEHARTLLKPGGYLAVEVPDITGPPGRWFGRNWWQIDAPRHLMFFSPPTLEKALDNAGFEVAKTRRYGMLTSMGYSLLQAMGFHYAGSNKLIYLSLSAALGLPFVPFLPLLPDFMMVVARAR